MRAAITWRRRPQTHDKVSVRANGRRDDASLQIDVDDLTGRLDTRPERLHSLTTVTARYVCDIPRSQSRVLAQSPQFWHGPRQKAVGGGIVQAPSFRFDGRSDRQRKRFFCLQSEQVWKLDLLYDT